jgi:dihydrofolate reductase
MRWYEAMRRLILHMMMSLDGYVASIDHSEDWMVAPDHERDAASLATARACDAAMAAHSSYQDMVGYWPTATGDTPDQRAYIERVNQMPKIVVGHSGPSDLGWANSTALVTSEADLPKDISALKQQDGGDIVVWGGASLARQLTRHELIDEYQLFIEPVALGGGDPLFTDADGWTRLRLLDAAAFQTGAILARYVTGESAAK